MPVTYQLDPSRSLVETRCTGNVTLEEVVEHFRSLLSEAALPERLSVLLDLGETRSLPDTPQVRSAVAELARLGAHLRFEACAIVASSDALFGMSRMFEAFAEPFFSRMQVFRSRA